MSSNGHFFNFSLHFSMKMVNFMAQNNNKHVASIRKAVKNTDYYAV